MGADHYEALCSQWRQRFLNMDQARLTALLPELCREGNALTLRLYGRKLRVDADSGEITAPEDSLPVTRTEKLTVYTLFAYVRPGARFRGEWVSFDRLRDTAVFAPAFRKGVLQSFAAAFSGRTGALEAACRALHGTPLPFGDVGYEIDSFQCIPVRFLFWQGEDEIPASANLLFDVSATDFIHPESIVTIASLGVSRLVQAADACLPPGAFGND